MYLYDLSPAEDDIRLRIGIGHTHLPVFDM